MMSVARRLSECTDFRCVFRLVKQCVREVLGRERAGVSLALVELPASIAAASMPDGTIILNRTLLRALGESLSRVEFNAYLFYVLLHEYLHTLGYVSDEVVEELAAEVCSEKLGRNHLSTKIAVDGLRVVLAKLRRIPSPSGSGVEVVLGIDSEVMDYYS